MGLVDKIISKAVGREVAPGEVLVVPVDAVYAQDGTAPLVIDVIDKELGGAPELKLRGRAYFFIDHAAPAPHVAAATTHKAMRDFARKHGLALIDVGNGISHQVMVERGLVRPGMIVLGADSHTPTIGVVCAFALGVGSTDAAIAIIYGQTWLKVPETLKIELHGALPKGVMSKDVALHIIKELGTEVGKAVEYGGEGLRTLSMDSRMTLTNMATEMGAETAIMPLDYAAKKWLEEKGYAAYRSVEGSEGSGYAGELHVELNRLGPLVAAPPDIDNVKGVEEVEGTEVDQVFIGSCTNGRLEDIEVAARILKGKSVREGVRCIVAPASRKVYQEALERGYIEVLLRAGCVIAPPTCGPCVGAHMGLLAEGEVAVATTNRNFPGRMGHKNSKVYITSPAVAAASAVEGKIADPRRYLP